MLRDVQRFMDDNSGFPPCLQLAHTASPLHTLTSPGGTRVQLTQAFKMKCVYYLYHFLSLRELRSFVTHSMLFSFKETLC
jgi:hypothetical protein